MEFSELAFTDEELEKVVDLFFHLTGNRISKGKKDFVERRLAQRMISLGIKNPNQYFQFIEEMSHHEIPHFIHALTIHTTTFFRNPKQYEFLVDYAIPKFIEGSQPGQTFSVWCGACSTGEEAFSVAMTIEDWMWRKRKRINYKIWATDIDRIVLEYAANGVYSVKRSSKIPSNFSSRFVTFDGQSPPEFFKINDNILENITWRENNLLDVEYSIPKNIKFDLVFINNVFIYFSPLEIKKAAQRMMSYMKDHAHLVVGAAESLYRVDVGLEMIKAGVYIKDRKSLLKGLSDDGKSSREESKGPVKVLIVDDSKVIHTWLERILASQSSIKIVGHAFNGIEGLEMLKEKSVDVILSDIQMPEMDGIEFLKEQMKSFKLPTLMLSSLSRDEGERGVKAYEYGAVDYIEKTTDTNNERVAIEISQKIRMAARAKLDSRPKEGKVISDELLKKQVILIGASTGGPSALRAILSKLPLECPPIVVVQHMPSSFTKEFANSLNNLCPHNVGEAMPGEILKPGYIYIAKGGYHIKIKERQGVLTLDQSNMEKVNGHRPSADILFESAEKLTEKYRVTAILLTGMGNDGAKGLKALHDKGALTIAQNKESSVVYGMARAAVELEAVDKLISLDEMSNMIIEVMSEPRRRRKPKAS